jgi:hypothetical protein
LPTGFVRIRYFGLLAHRRRKQLMPLCLELLAASVPPASPPSAAPPNRPTWTCPLCGGAMKVIERLTARELRLRAPPDKGCRP